MITKLIKDHIKCRLQDWLIRDPIEHVNQTIQDTYKALNSTIARNSIHLFKLETQVKFLPEVFLLTLLENNRPFVDTISFGDKKYMQYQSNFVMPNPIWLIARYCQMQNVMVGNESKNNLPTNTCIIDKLPLGYYLNIHLKNPET